MGAITPTAGGLVFFGDVGGNYALNAANGHELWPEVGTLMEKANGQFTVITDQHNVFREAQNKTNDELMKAQLDKLKHDLRQVSTLRSRINELGTDHPTRKSPAASGA